MRQRLAFLVGASSVLLARVAAAASFDIATFDPPAGFASERSGDHLVFSRIDQRAGTFCQIAIYASRRASGGLESEFRIDWQELAVQRRTSDFPRAERGVSSKGIAWIAGEQQLAAGNSAYRARLYVLQADKAVLSIAVNATNADVQAQCRPTVDALIASLSLPGASAQTQKAAPTLKKGVAGVWMGFKADFPRSAEPKPAWLVLFDDGFAFRNLPSGGLLGFDREQARAKLPASSATYTFEKGGGRVRLAGVDPKFDLKLALDGKGRLLVDDVPYQRCVEVDGLKLAGAWTSFADPGDPALDRLPPGQRPVFRFTKEGRFTDEGVFASFLHRSNDGGDAHGAGRYAIKAFTLTLNYDDGRVKQVALHGFPGLDPAADDRTLYIERSSFRKRK